ncbi:DNA damage-inducible protein 1 [Golovinomyces cichoracearum]|uniref:DNA damage-inducible protein 1 n=1 Tax=Golovinomyces cichoracearum TaxID=62708 RepID=A0A420IMA1_9PEZI|nr:DNA damage-inducible protein 1 [Golovinomyces cichoracearum]
MIFISVQYPLAYTKRITINITSRANIGGDLISLEISPDTTVCMLKALVQAEAQIPSASQNLYHNGRLLNDESRTMEQLQISDGEMLAIHVREATPGQSRAQRVAYPPPRQVTNEGQSYPDPETIRLHLLGNPTARAQAISRRPELAEVLESPERFMTMLHQINERERLDQARRHQQIASLNADPFDVAAQARIEEIIREERVQENLQNAIEHNPEVFGHVHMLYIDVEVNGIKVKAFVDSGAQATIMSPSCAENCGIMRLVDKRFAGVARGVGTATIIGKVHSAQIKIGSLYLPCSFTVMEGKDVDLLLGLDMLKRHQACIDLSKGKLIIQETEVPFLGEADIPRYADVQRSQEPKVPGPGGMMIGARSGAIFNPSLVTQSVGSSASASAGVSALPSGPSGSQRNIFPPEAVDQLVTLGFSRNEAIQALEACGGNVEYAAGLLFQG